MLTQRCLLFAQALIAGSLRSSLASLAAMLTHRHTLSGQLVRLVVLIVARSGVGERALHRAEQPARRRHLAAAEARHEQLRAEPGRGDDAGLQTERGTD